MGLDSFRVAPKMKVDKSKGVRMPSGPQTPVRPPTSAFEVGASPAGAQPLPGVQRATQRPVQLVPVIDAASPEADSLRAELELLTQVRDRHVVEVLGIQVRDGKLWCASEAVSGEDLSTQL